MKYDVFISYARGKDAPAARAVARGIEGIGRPWYRRYRSVPRVFLDQTDSEASGDWKKKIQSSLDSCEFLILVASPRSANRPGVEVEVQRWLDHGRIDKLSIIRIEGQIQWDETSKDFDWDVTNALPSALAGRFNTEPSYGDIGPREDLDVASFNFKDGRFLDAIATVATPIHAKLGLARDKKDLLVKHIGEQRKLAVVLCGLVLLAFLGLVAAIYWGYSAKKSATIARVEAMSSKAIAAATGNDPTLGFLGEAVATAAAAFNQLDQPATRRAMTIIDNRLPGSLRYAGERLNPVRGIVAHANRLFVLEGNHSVHEYDLATFKPVKKWTRADFNMAGIASISTFQNGFLVLGGSTAAVVTGGTQISVPLKGWANFGAWSQPRKRLAFAGSPKKTLEMANLEELPQTVSCDSARLSIAGPIEFIDDGSHLAVGGSNGEVIVLDSDTCQIVSKQAFGRQSVTGIHYLPQSRRIVVSTFDGVYLTDLELNQIQAFPDQQGTSLAPLRGKPYEGFVVGYPNGSLRLYSIDSSGLALAGSQSPMILPGTLGSITFVQKLNKLVIGGKEGFFVDSKLRGTFASVDLEKDANNNWIFARHRIEKTIHKYPKPHYATHYRKFGNGFIATLTDGSIQHMTPDGKIRLLTNVDRDGHTNNSVCTALSSWENTIYFAKLDRSEDGRDIGSTIFTLNDSVQKKVGSFAGHVHKLAAFPNGYFAMSGTRTFVVFGSEDPQELPLKLNGNQGHQTITVDPTGQYVSFGLFDGFRIMQVKDVLFEDTCPLIELNGDAGVEAEFSEDGTHIVLATWNGEMSLWKRGDTCWSHVVDYEGAPGRMITNLTYDSKSEIVAAGRLQDPPLLEIWNAKTGNRNGRGYKLASRDLNLNNHKILVAQQRGIVELDLTQESILKRFCQIAEPLSSSGLVEKTLITGTCGNGL